MPYLDPEEEALFSKWLEQKNNPAIDLLAALQNIEIKNLADLEKMAKIVANFTHASAEIIIAGLKQLPNDHDLKKGSFLKPALGVERINIPPDLRLLFSSFCLEQAGATQSHDQNLITRYQFYLHGISHTEETQYLEWLIHAFTVLKEGKALVIPTEPELHDNFQPNLDIVRLKKALAPLEEICSEKNLPISKELGEQLNALLSFLKTVSDTYLRETQKDESIIAHIEKLSFDVSCLAAALIDSSNVSKNSLSDQNKLITELENTFLPYLNSPLFKDAEKVLKKLVEAAHRTSAENIKKARETLLADFFAPLGGISKQITELGMEWGSLKTLCQADITRRFDRGQSRREIFGALSNSRRLIIEAANTYLRTKSDSDKKVLISRMDHLSNALEAREIISPLDSIINSRLNFLGNTKEKFKKIYTILNGEIISFLEQGYSKEQATTKFSPLISELEVLGLTLANEAITKEEKLNSIHLLKSHLDEQYSVFSPQLVRALRELLGEALSSLVLDVVETTANFFKPATKEKELKELVRNAEKEIKTSSSPQPK